MTTAWYQVPHSRDPWHIVYRNRATVLLTAVTFHVNAQTQATCLYPSNSVLSQAKLSSPQCGSEECVPFHQGQEEV